MRTVRIEASGSYDILIGPGLLAEAGARIANVVAPCRAAMVTDDNVDLLYGERVMRSLEAAGFDAHRYVFDHGEQSKTMDTLWDMLEDFGEHGLGKSDMVVCLGGGVVGDVGGFAAAVYGRGMRFVQIPTTLLAAVDSSVGGKTAVNLRSGKNMAGAFAQPTLVLCDTDVLRELPDELIRCGAAEIIKYGALADVGLMTLAQPDLLMKHIELVVERCLCIKRDFVQADEFDRGSRQMLNLGHTIGHAVEKCSGYRMPHGEAVAIGLAAIARAAHVRGYSGENCTGPIERALHACGLETRCPYSRAEVLEAALMDKKRDGGEIALIVPVSLGKCERMMVPVSWLGDWLASGGIA